MTATPEPCPVCKGKCCRDSYRYKLTHMGDEFYEHFCEACEDGTKDPIQYTTEPITLPRHSLEAVSAYSEGYAAGERRERVAVVAGLRERSAATREWNGTETAVSLTYALAADAIERGEHRRKGEK